MTVTDVVSSRPIVPDLMLTTIDNPFNPFDQYDEWYQWDAQAGYHSPGMLARIVVSSDEESELDQVLAINEAIEEICRINALGVWTKVQRNS